MSYQVVKSAKSDTMSALHHFIPMPITVSDCINGLEEQINERSDLTIVDP